MNVKWLFPSVASNGFNSGCTDEADLIGNLTTGIGTTLRREARIRACSVSTSTVVATLIHDPQSGKSTTVHTHKVTVASDPPAEVMLTAGSESAFVGQTVTLTASAPEASGAVSSYQWQEWLNGAWANLGATSTSATRSVSSSVAGLRIFRVVVSYTSATMGESAPVTVQWRPMSVSVSASPEYPVAGDAATSSVTLTATADAPSGATYQWQEDTGSGWTHLATTTSPTREVYSATRGTRKFRVAVSHSGVAAQSEPVYVTWDEWAIVADMIGELSAAVASSTAYTTAEDALLSCMNAASTTTSTSTGSVPKSGRGARADTLPSAATFAGFDELLASYTGDVKARMEAGGDCAATSTAMFSANQSVARDELATLKAGDAVYAAWLATPQGQLFETNLGDPDELKFVSYLGATTFEHGEFTAPLYAPPDDDGATGQDGPDERELPIVGTGLDCLPQSVRGCVRSSN